MLVGQGMDIRRYQPGEEQVLRELFYGTVHRVNLRDYTEQQVNAWAPAEYDRSLWLERVAGMNPFVCVVNGEIAGYASLLPNGYVDHFYVHEQRQGMGIGRRLMEAVEAEAETLSLIELTADVSITARPFFERMGFQVVTPQQVERNGVIFRNFKMHKTRRRFPTE